MSVNEVNKTTGETSLVAGGTLYADAPIGAILAFGGTSAPAGWMICNGAAVSRTTYAALFAAIGTAFGAGDGSTTFNIPDLREATTKGAGETGQTVGNHVKTGGLAVGEFLDDRVQAHTHASPSGSNFFITGSAASLSGGEAKIYDGSNSTGGMNAGRGGDTTEVKAVGVNYIIKAQQVALPADFKTELDKKQNITDNTLQTTSKTVPGAINELNNDLTPSEISSSMVSTHKRDMVGTMSGNVAVWDGYFDVGGVAESSYPYTVATLSEHRPFRDIVVTCIKTTGVSASGNVNITLKTNGDIVIDEYPGVSFVIFRDITYIANN